MRYIEIPNTPNICLNRVLVSEKIGTESLQSLKNLGIEPIFAFVSNRVMSEISHHADITIAHLGKNRFICSPDSYSYYKDILTGADLICGPYDLGKIYPNDVYYNITALKDYIFAYKNQIEILKMNNPMSQKILKANQGYTKCNICVVDDNAIITSDISIYNEAKKNDIDVLLIKSGEIELDGFDYGFIGGATGKLSKNILALNGELKTHSDADNIKAFCKNYGVDIYELKKGDICDIGSILPISY